MTKVKAKMLGDKVMLHRQEVTESRGGITLPQAKKELVGTVVSIGPEVMSDDIEIGAKVFFALHNMKLVTLDGQDYLVVKEEEILGVLLDE